MWLLNFFGLVTRKEHDSLKAERDGLCTNLGKTELRYMSTLSEYNTNMLELLKQLLELRQELAKEKLRNSITDELELLAGLSGESCVTEKMLDAISAYSNMQSFIEERKNEISKNVEDTERPAVH